ncbi:MAG TPA: hypothetical protein VMR06_12795 [Dokdonella sp.]|nr:hypothetical protein [Dokdonella sp.]HUD42861.1 hypothetical protein [Dokdonella sp.]
MKTEMIVLRGLFVITMATVIAGFGSFVRTIDTAPVQIAQTPVAAATHAG